MEYTHAEHTFGPVYDKHSRFLILGSFPSVKSREINFYYGHPQNRFWKLLPALLSPGALLDSVEAKKSFLQKHRIALWDVIESCDILGSSDSSIRNVVPNDIRRILAAAPIEAILCNGGKSYDLFRKYCTRAVENICSIQSDTRVSAAGGSDACLFAAKRSASLTEPSLPKLPPVYKLPSTSPANAAWSLERLAAAWGEYLR